MTSDLSPAVLGLMDRHDLHRSQGSQLATILTELSQNDLAPTSVRDPARATEVHLADSLVALDVELLRDAARVADIGAGAGFPGLPLAVALPRSEVRLIESQARKCAFMQRICELAAVDNARIVCSRAEEWRSGAGDNDAVVARALAPRPVVLEYAAPLLRLGGALVDWRGQRDPDEEKAAAAAAGLLGLRLAEIRRVVPYEGVRNHHLHVYVKESRTPDRFPRRPGMARKKPLGASPDERADPDRR
jgi:16S rRNA (guanine527-N7)-methyltransferase